MKRSIERTPQRPDHTNGVPLNPNGIPMAFHTFSGNESEKTNMLPAIQQIKKDYEIGRLIVVADRGLNTGDNTFVLS